MQHSSIVRSAFYNNDGVQHMNKGRYNDAITAFTLALEILKPIYGGGGGGGGYQQQQYQQYQHQQYQAFTMNSNSNSSRPQHMPCTEEVHQAAAAATTAVPMEYANIYAAQATAASQYQQQQQQQNSNYYYYQGNQQHQHQHEPKNVSTTETTTTTTTSDTSNEQPSNYIFRDPIDIPIPSVVKSRVTEKMVTKLSIVVMYNLGLSFHLSAIETNSLDRLMRARMLYEFAFEMHMEEGCDVTLLYTLALMNNLGLIYYLLGENERSHHCFQNMLSTMMFLLEADDARKIKQWDGLLSNVMTYVFIDSKISAPAA